MTLVCQGHAGAQFGHSDGSDRYVVIACDHVLRCCPGALSGDEHAGVQNQPAGHAGGSAIADSRTARRSCANASSGSDERNSSATSPPLPALAGPIVAIRRPPLVTMTVLPF